MRKARGAGEREGTPLFSQLPTFPNHARLISAWLVFATSLLSESLAQTVCVTTFRKKKRPPPPNNAYPNYQWLEHSRNLSCTTTISLSNPDLPVRFSPGAFVRDRPGGHLESSNTCRKSSVEATPPPPTSSNKPSLLRGKDCINQSRLSGVYCDCITSSGWFRMVYSPAGSSDLFLNLSCVIFIFFLLFHFAF